MNDIASRQACFLSKHLVHFACKDDRHLILGAAQHDMCWAEIGSPYLAVIMREKCWKNGSGLVGEGHPGSGVH